MTTQEIFKTENATIEAQLSPKRNTMCRIAVNGMATDARIYADDTLEEATFQISSSTNIKTNHKEIAQAALDFLAAQNQ